MYQMNNSAVERGLRGTGGYLMRKLQMSSFVYFQLQAAGFPARHLGQRVI